jgi:hypothetical protein
MGSVTAAAIVGEESSAALDRATAGKSDIFKGHPWEKSREASPGLQQQHTPSDTPLRPDPI